MNYFIFVLIYVLNLNLIKSEYSLVQTTSGLIKGITIEVLNQSINQYLGIPYALPPTGSLRFAKPKPLEKPYKDIIDATKTRYSCIQPIVGSNKDLYQDEDCLALNIWSPKEGSTSTKLKPVMFYIHGGALSTGSIYSKKNNGSALASYNVVIVTTNYRLGKFGFLYGGDEAPGNVGLFDQVLALKWVRDNIHLFGGDKNQITIFGESAGSWCISAHLLSPLSKGLFKRAILQSGAHMFNKDKPVISRDMALISAKQTAKQLNCLDDKKWLECLKKVDPKHLIQIIPGFTFLIDGTEFLPHTAQTAFNEIKFNKDLDLILGITRDEGMTLVEYVVPGILKKNLTDKDIVHYIKVSDQVIHNLNLSNINKYYFNNINKSDSNAIKWKIVDFTGDLLMKCPTYLFAKRYFEHSSNKPNLYFYKLTHTARGAEFEKNYGIAHATEQDFVFGLILFNPNTTKEDIVFSKQIMKYWTDFAKYGKPDPKWPKLIDSKTHTSITQIKELNPKTPNKYFKNLFEKTCDGFLKNYY